MATIDLTNDIAPQHPFRPVKPYLSDIRAKIDELDTSGAYPTSLVEKMNRNDLVATLRALGGDPDDLELDPILPTGASAGEPGSFTPAGAILPADLAELVLLDIPADPLTDWGTGYVVLRDGSSATWDGSDWVVV